ncbi:NAD(P)-binding protein [Colletotrichum somersetense]|nr:NAD(P)-binding protein [Colletotrichum somersetense]
MSNSNSSSETWSLKVKAAIITAGSRGIGSRIAVHFARKGLSNLAITYLANKAEAETTIEKCRELGVNAIAIQADVTDATVGRNIIEDALNGLNVTTVDILVNNAALSDISRAANVKTIEAENFNEIMIANVYTPVSLMVAFIEYAPKDGGRVINISSLASKLGNTDPMITYGATKAALDSFTRSFANTFSAATGIPFNSVCVGPTETDAFDMVSSLIPGFHDTQIAMSTAANRVGNVDDIAYIVGFLAREEVRWMNGASVSANGGHRQTLALFG